MFGKFIRGVSPKGRVRADNYFNIVILKIKKLRNVIVGLAAVGSWRKYGETV